MMAAARLSRRPVVAAIASSRSGSSATPGISPAPR